MPVDEVSLQLIQIERAALDRWGRGDPDGFLEISAPDVTYFDPFLPEGIHGLGALRQYYAQLRGKIFVECDEMIDPKVQASDETAILSYRYTSRGRKGDEMRWNTTEVYRRGEDGWRILHSHWSFTQPDIASLQA
ncbi:MAG: nuclear transport factor 2 family protein [Terracidiphilus sp.]